MRVDLELTVTIVEGWEVAGHSLRRTLHAPVIISEERCLLIASNRVSQSKKKNQKQNKTKQKHAKQKSTIKVKK